MYSTKPTRTQALEEQTEIRRRLLEGGYSPLPNLDKRCVLRGWPRVEVDTEAIDRWADMRRYCATGVRVEGGLIALDFDVDDGPALDAIWQAMPGTLRALLDAMPMRYGRGEKFALFAALSGGSRKRDMKSGFFSRPGETATHGLEIWTGESARQCGAYGPHTRGDDGETLVAYTWHDKSLLDVPRDRLPEITGGQLENLRLIVTETLDRLGWTHDAAAALAAHGKAGEEVFDLEPAMHFITQSDGEGDLAWLERTCQAAGESIRLDASFMEAAAVNATRCLAGISPRDQCVYVHDFKTDRNHRPRDLKPRKPSPLTVARMNELLKKGA